MEKANLGDLDIEWIQLIKEALDMGLNTEEIRKFLNNESKEPVGSGK